MLRGQYNINLAADSEEDKFFYTGYNFEDSVNFLKLV